MSGAEPEASVQTAHVGKELDKVQARVKLLNDMLDQAKPNEKFVSGDAYDQVASNLRSVQPRLQKWINQAQEEESEQLQRFLEVNDLINQSITRYDALQSGDTTKAQNSKAKLDLISFDDEDAPSDAPKPTPANAGALDDLAALSLGGDDAPRPSATPAAPAQPAAAPTPSQPARKATAFDLLGDLDDAPAPMPSAAPAPRPQAAPAPAAAPAAQNPPPPRDPFAGLDLLR